MAHTSTNKDKDMKVLVANIDADTHAALIAWAQSEDRSLAGQVRLAMREVVPAKHWPKAKTNGKK
jgi:hypothetical protein